MGEVIDMPGSESAVPTILSALFAAQGELGKIVKNAKNDHFGNKYADLNALMDAITPVLRAHGFMIYHIPLAIDGAPALKAVLWYQPTGEALEALIPLVGATDLQKVGSAITYARRYSTVAMLNLLTEADDDAEGAVGRPKARSSVGRARQTSRTTSTSTTSAVSAEDPSPSAPTSSGPDTAPVNTTPSIGTKRQVVRPKAR